MQALLFSLRQGYRQLSVTRQAGVLLGLFALGCIGVVGIVSIVTQVRIAVSEQQALLHTLRELIPADWHDNDLARDILMVQDRAYLGSARTVAVYRARKAGLPVAVILAPAAPDGYGGEIQLLVAIRLDGSLAGVRVIAHKETPGLGDPIELAKSSWILRFNDLSLAKPAEKDWKVKKDGGVFDQFTGATITPRAVVRAIANALRYYRIHHEELFVIKGQP